MNRAIMNPDAPYLDKAQTLRILGVKPQTLYAYVSRGLIRSSVGSDGKSRLYSREDVQAVATRSRNTVNVPVEPAETVIGAGASMPTRISCPGPGGLTYHGISAVALAGSGRTFEEVSELLWTGDLPSRAPHWPAAAVTPNFRRVSALLPLMAAQGNVRTLMALVLETYRAELDTTRESAAGGELPMARQLIRIMVPVTGLLRDPPDYEESAETDSVASGLAAATGLEASADVLTALNCCLVLSADNGLATSTLAARVAASAGADLFACIATALGAFEGTQTGLDCDRAEMLLAHKRSTSDYLAELRGQLDRQVPLAGYESSAHDAPEARTQFLLELAATFSGRNPHVPGLIAKVRAAESELGLQPGLAIGMVAIARALGMPRQAPGALMAIGRSAGWIAHVLEQRLARYVVRPHGHYTGPSPAG